MARVHCTNCENFRKDSSADGSFTDEALICEAPQNKGNWHSADHWRYSPDKRNANMDCPWYKGVFESGFDLSGLIKKVAFGIVSEEK